MQIYKSRILFQHGVFKLVEQTSEFLEYLLFD